MNTVITLGALAVAGMSCLVSAGVIWLARQADAAARELEERRVPPAPRDPDEMPLPRFTPFTPRSQEQAGLPAGPLTVAERQEHHINALLLGIGIGMLIVAHLPIWSPIP